MAQDKLKGGEQGPRAKIEVEAVAEDQFRVRVIEGQSESTHRITVLVRTISALRVGRSARRNL
jgi:hypothetical protein